MPSTRDGIALVVLTGGRGRRLGFRKDHLPTRDGAWLQRIADAVRDASPVPIREAWLAGSHLDVPPNHGGFRRVDDVVVEAGPLAGIASALRSITTPWAWVCACDGMPPSAALLARMWTLTEGDSCQAVVPESASGVQPLPALYHRSAAVVALARLRARRLRLMEFLEELDLRVLPWDQVNALDCAGSSLVDVDRPCDLTRIERSRPGKTPLTERC